MDKKTELSENLLDSWLYLSMNLWNERLVSYMSYNEALVCHLLYFRKLSHPDDPSMTLMQLSKMTHILKSQMNKTLASLEENGFIDRERSKEDKRIIYITLKDDNLDLYEKEHNKVLEVVNQVIDRLGEERSQQAIEIFTDVADEISIVMEKGK